MYKSAIIIGSGIAGLAAAIRLKVKGFEVDVYESNASPGGKLTEFKINDYRFDFGPSLFTLPEQVEELFKLAGKNPGMHFEYLKLPVVCNYFWEDGKHLKAYADVNAFAEEVETKLGEPAYHVRQAK